MNLRSRIIEIIAESGHGYKEKTRTIHTTCPICNKDDKFSILKESGACVCYRGSCTFGKRWFVEWIELVFNLSREDAKAMLFNKQKDDYFI